MKWNVLFSWLVLLFFFQANGQKEKYWLIDTQSEYRHQVKDSLAASRYLDSLAENQYYFLQLHKVEKSQDEIFIYYNKGRNFHKAKVYFSDSLAHQWKLENGMIIENLDSLKASIHEKYTQKGFVFNRVKTDFLGMENQIPKVKLSVLAAPRRTVNGFVAKGYEKIPPRFLKNLTQQYAHKPYNQAILEAIHRELQHHPLIRMERPAQTLFTKDSTQIYLFIEKKKGHIFDGMIGFTNDQKERLSFSGTAHLQFNNLFNHFESIGIYWQRTPEKSQTFDLNFQFPYILGTNVGADIRLNIFRQYEDFANIKLYPTLFYHISNWQKIGLKAGLEISSHLNDPITPIDDFSKKGIGLSYSFIQPTDFLLLQHKTNLYFEGQYFNNYYENKDLNAHQIKLHAKAERNFHLKGNHWLYAHIEAEWLHSDQEVSYNEMYRLGGWNSFRGFNENILAAQKYYFTTLEYRYLINDNSFFDVFGQYGQLLNDALKLRPKLYSFGIGFHFNAPIGLMSFQITNGSMMGETPRFADTKIHWGVVTRF